MTWFEDLSPYAFGPAPEAGALNVGWLDRNHSFATGETEPELAERLVHLAVELPVNPTRGWEPCPFCSGEYPIRVPYGAGKRALGDAEIRVRGRDTVVFAAPNLIAHYVGAHRYLPPQAFVEAVMTDQRIGHT